MKYCPYLYMVWYYISRIMFGIIFLSGDDAVCHNKTKLIYQIVLVFFFIPCKKVMFFIL